MCVNCSSAWSHLGDRVNVDFISIAAFTQSVKGRTTEPLYGPTTLYLKGRTRDHCYSTSGPAAGAGGRQFDICVKRMSCEVTGWDRQLLFSQHGMWATYNQEISKASEQRLAANSDKKYSNQKVCREKHKCDFYPSSWGWRRQCICKTSHQPQIDCTHHLFAENWHAL